jgi:hypothetical protein
MHHYLKNDRGMIIVNLGILTEGLLWCWQDPKPRSLDLQLVDSLLDIGSFGSSLLGLEQLELGIQKIFLNLERQEGFSWATSGKY